MWKWRKRYRVKKKRHPTALLLYLAVPVYALALAGNIFSTEKKKTEAPSSAEVFKIRATCSMLRWCRWVCVRGSYTTSYIVAHCALSFDSPCSFYSIFTFMRAACEKEVRARHVGCVPQREIKLHTHTHKITRTVAIRVALFNSVKFASWICLRGAHFPFVPFVPFFSFLFSSMSHLLSFIRRQFFFPDDFHMHL